MTVTPALVGSEVLADVSLYVGETLHDATGSVTWAGTDLAGDAAGSGTADRVSAGRYTAELAAVDAPDTITVAWSCTLNGLATVTRTRYLFQGGWYFEVSALRNSDGPQGTARPLSDTDVWPLATLQAARAEAEAEAERILGYSCVPRAAAETLTVRGTGRYGVLVPSRAHVRAVRSATLSSSGADLDVSSWVVEGEHGQRIRVPLATGTRVRVVYEHGLDAAPFDIGRACMARARHALERIATALPATTERYVVTDTGTFSVSLPGVRSTGNAHIDAVYLPASVRSL